MPGKVHASIVDARVKQRTKGKILEVQGGFRKRWSCIDQMFTVRQLSEKVLEKEKQMVVACIDLEKAHDTVRRDALWQVLEDYGIEGRLLGRLELSTRRVRHVLELEKRCEAVFQLQEV